MPSVIAVLSGVGIFASLMGDGWLDVLSWVFLGIPVGVVVVVLLKRRA
jgi:uncharacterized membrane protein YjjP (DUF1212 family)